MCFINELTYVLKVDSGYFHVLHTSVLHGAFKMKAVTIFMDRQWESTILCKIIQ